MNPEKCIIGIDFGKTNVRFGIAVDESELKYFTKLPYRRGSPQEMHRQIFEGIDAALEACGYDRTNVLGIGIDVPAVVNRETGVILWGPDWDFMAGASLTKPIAERYGVPVLADVDTVMPTWGELWAGVGRTCDRFAVLTWGTGLGAGLVIDGEVQEYACFPSSGTHGSAMTIGRARAVPPAAWERWCVAAVLPNTDATLSKKADRPYSASCAATILHG